VRKLGIKEGHRVVLLGAPAGLALAWPDGVTARTRLTGPADVVLFFTTLRASLEKRIDALGQAVRPAGSVWVAWPKKAARVATDMTEDVVRDVALPLGLVDTKVCAIDDTWSGLKLVWRKSTR
jgi:hypothetical protein